MIRRNLAAMLAALAIATPALGERNAGYLAEREVVKSTDLYTWYVLIDEVTTVIEHWVRAHETICIEPNVLDWDGSGAQSAPRATIRAGSEREVASAWLESGDYGTYSINIELLGHSGPC